MRNIGKAAIAATITLVIELSTAELLAVVEQRFQIVGTNLVLSWPSTGNEHYLIQFRAAWDVSSTWSILTNNYPANGTNRSTYTIYGVVSPSGPGGTNNWGDPPPSPTAPLLAIGSAVLAMPTNGSVSAVPLALYPPAFDLSGLLIYDPLESEWVAGSSYSRRDGAGATSQIASPNTLESLTANATAGFYRVFHIPELPSGVTNYTFDGPTFIPIDFKDYRDEVENIVVLIDGTASPHAVFTSFVDSGETNWGVGIYFDLIRNATHQIQLQTTIRLNDTVGDGSDHLTLTSPIQTILVQNLVTFTNWDDLIFSTSYTFKAQTRNTNTDWWIDIFDYTGAYVNGYSGHTYDGRIEWTWDLRDTSGNLRDDLDYDPFLDPYITFNSVGNGTTVTRPTPTPMSQYPTVGGWLISYCDRFYLDARGADAGGDSYYQPAVSALAGGPALRGVPWYLFDIKFGTNVYTQAERNSSWADLKGYLAGPGYRNFYYHGHGNANTIGCDAHAFDASNHVVEGVTLRGSSAYLTSQVVSNTISFGTHSGAVPYRFVWLDGCSTANGNWPGAFGISRTSNSLSYYTSSTSNPSHRRPSAFIGWNQAVGGPAWGTPSAFWNFRTQWMVEWSYNSATKSLVDALSDARRTANWPPGGDAQLAGALRVYGYTGLKFDEYNHKSDWSWP